MRPLHWLSPIESLSNMFDNPKLFIENSFCLFLQAIGNKLEENTHSAKLPPCLSDVYID